MKAVLFCNLPYSFSILQPIAEELLRCNDEVIWYISPKIESLIPFKTPIHYTTSLKDINAFNSDAIFVPGNIVPHYLRGVKIQVFHGLAGEKKGHFRIRHYFDLYLTQGPYFTERFKKLAQKYRDFDVVETGWPKLDRLFVEDKSIIKQKEQLKMEYNAKHIVLYAPTFSPSLTSATEFVNPLIDIAKHGDYLVLVKFHDKMDKSLISTYNEMAETHKNIMVVKDADINDYLKIADLMVSDTSSVVYEFILLNKPVITLNTTSEHIYWEDINSPNLLFDTIQNIQLNDVWFEKRKWIIDNYHPQTDGLSSKRVIEAVNAWIKEKGVPQKRKISYFRRKKVEKAFGKIR